MFGDGYFIMRSKTIIFSTIFLTSVVCFGCGGSTSVSNTGNAANGNSNNPLETKAPAKDETVNDAPTLTPVYKAYCDARIKKDEAALRKVYSQDTIKFFEAEMKDQKIKTLVAYHDDEISGKICQVRNEQIMGDKAIAEIISDSYPNGIKIEFVKENGEWKMTNKRANSIMPANTNSNTVK